MNFGQAGRGDLSRASVPAGWPQGGRSGAPLTGGSRHVPRALRICSQGYAIIVIHQSIATLGTLGNDSICRALHRIGLSPAVPIAPRPPQCAFGFDVS